MSLFFFLLLLRLRLLLSYDSSSPGTSLLLLQSSRKWIGFCSAPSGGRGFTSEPRGSRTSSHRLTTVCWTGGSLRERIQTRVHQEGVISGNESHEPPPPPPPPPQFTLSVAGGGLIDQLHTHSSDGGL